MANTRQLALFKKSTYEKAKTMLTAGKIEYSKYEGYYELSANTHSDNADIDVSEIKFAKNNAGDYVAFFAAKKIPGLWKAEEYRENDLFYLIFHKGEYEVYDSASKSKIKVQPSPYEVLVHKYLDSEGANLLEGVYSGTFCIQPSTATLSLVEKSNAWNVLFAVSLLEESTLLKESSEKAARGKGGYGGQTESAKLNDRKEFLLAQLGMDPKITLVEAAVLLQADEVKGPKENPVQVALDLIDSLIV